MNKVESAALKIAAGEVGTKEVGYTNTGRRVGEYQAATTLGGSGWSWCAAFVAWVILQACIALKLANFWRNSASCDELLAFARKRNILRSEPAAGMVGLVMKSSGDATHIFFVEEVHDEGRLTTLEGNTNLTGGANGDGVYRLKTRRTSQRRARDGGPKYLFIDWGALAPEAQAAQPGYRLVIGQNPVSGPTDQPLVMPLVENISLVPLSLWGKYLGLSLGWDNEDQVPFFSDKGGARHEVTTQVVKLNWAGDGQLGACAALRDLAAEFGLQVAVDPKKRVVTVYRKAA